MKIRENVPIASLTTMRLGGDARFVVEIEKVDEIEGALRFAREKGLPVWIMGGGANTIGRDEGFDGVIILNKIKGVYTICEDEKSLTVKAMAGEVWDDLVAFTCERGCTGIEAMSLIPGTVGAAPVQNIGAYGQDVSQTIVEAEVFDLAAEEFLTLARDEMDLGYRSTRFNQGKDAGRFVILSVTFKVEKGELKPPFYNSLQRYIDEHGETDFSPQNIRRMVCEIRDKKLPDPKRIASAGSFFKNVMLDKKGADAAEAKGIPLWRTDTGGKINSGWLIEACGLKGKELHGFKVCENAALVLINEKAKSYEDLAAARTEIIDTVREKFGYTLEQEPVEIKNEGDGPSRLKENQAGGLSE